MSCLGQRYFKKFWQDRLAPDTAFQIHAPHDRAMQLALAIRSMAFGFIESMMSASFNDPTCARACVLRQWI